MAWLATGSYQSKPTASMLRGLDHAPGRLAPGHAAQPGPGLAAAGLAHRSVGGDRGEETAYHRLPGVARRECGVVDRAALVDVAVHVVGVHARVAQLQQVEQHPVVLVDR